MNVSIQSFSFYDNYRLITIFGLKFVKLQAKIILKFPYMKKIIISVLLCALTISLNAQTKTKSKPKETKTSKKTESNVKEEPVYEEVMMASDDYGSSSNYSSNNNSNSSSFEPIKNIKFNNKYEIYTNINDQYDFFHDKSSSRYSSIVGIVDKNGNVILPNIFYKSYNNNNQNDLILYTDNNYGIFNIKNLRWSVPLIYDEISSINNSLYSTKKNGKYGIIDNNNKIIVPFQWSNINTISNLENYIIVSETVNNNKLKGIYSLIERKLTTPCKYSYLTKIDRQSYFTAYDGSKYNIIDINGNPKFSKWYEDLTIPSKGKMNYIVKLDNKYGIVDDSEKVILPIEYLEFSKSPYNDGSYLARDKNGKYGFITIDGKVTLPFEYDNLTRRNYYDNVLSVRNGKCGLVQINNGMPYEITTCDYDEIEGNKIMIVKKDDKYGLLDVYGQHLTPIEFQSIEALDDNSSEGTIYKAKINGMYKLINDQGKSLNDGLYTDIDIISKKAKTSYYSSIQYNYLKCKNKNGKYSVIDKVGKSICPLTFDEIDSENNNIFIVKNNGKYGLFSLLNQKQILDFKYDLLIRSNDYYLGIIGNKIDIINSNSENITITPTIK